MSTKKVSKLKDKLYNEFNNKNIKKNKTIKKKKVSKLVNLF